MLKLLAVFASFVLVLLLGGRALGVFDSRGADLKRDTAGTSGPEADNRLSDRGRWVRDMTAICRRADAWYERLPEPETKREIVRLLARSVSENRSVNAEILALRPPAGAEQAMRKLRALFASDERLLADLLAAARARDWTAYRVTFATAQRVYRQEDRIHRRWGAVPCTRAFMASH
jgi:hypothetical protein